MQYNRYLTAGEFARITGTTKHTLFHYDDIGLFSPDFRAANGYRCYSVEQLEIFDVIRTLRELDMPLAEIQSYLNQKSPEAFLKLMEQEDAMITQKILSLKKTRNWIREKSAQFRQIVSQDFSSPEFLDMPRQYYVSAYTASSEDTAVAKIVGELYDYCEKGGYKSCYGVSYLQHSQAISQGRFTEYHTVCMLFDSPPRKLSYTEKPAGTYLCVYHRGHWRLMQKAYEELFSFAQKHGCKLEDPFFEEYLLDELSVTGPENYVTRISALVSAP